MIYVMECGPVNHRGRECWLVFSLDLSSRQTKLRVTWRRKDARDAVASELGGAKAACCASLADFGRPLGWRVRSVPDEVLKLAAQALVGLENEEALGMLAYSPVADAWLRACVAFLDVRPWENFTIHTPLTVTFTRDTPETRVVSIGGAGSMPPSLMLLPDRAALDCLSRDDGGKTGLEEAFIMGFDELDSAAADALGLAYGATFHPVLLRLRAGKPQPVTELELLELTCALAAVTSLATGRPVGRAVVDGLEAIVLPLESETALRS